MYKKALLVYNGNAGQADIQSVLASVTEVLSAGVGELRLAATEKPGDTERICREQGEQVDLLAVLGGDGTVHEAVNGLALLDRPPVVGILPGGTCNDFSRSLGHPQDVEKAAAALLKGVTRRVDMGG